MNFVVSRILDFMAKEDTISRDEDVEAFYRYGIEITISSFLNIFLVVMLGVITGHLYDSFAYLFSFIFIRSFTGGYHAATYFRCNLLMCVTFMLVILFASVIDFSLALFSVIGFVSIIVIAILSPIENVNKPIDNRKRPRLKISGVISSIVITIIGTILINREITVGKTLVLTISLIAILILVAKFAERGKER